MNKHKLILSIFLFLLAGLLYAQERNFEKEIQETEKQIQNLQSSCLLYTSDAADE